MPEGLTDHPDKDVAASASTIEKTEIHGLTTFWREIPDWAGLALTFRVGYADEPLPLSGITHVVEHLALTALDPKPSNFNGVVDATRTSFYIKASAEEATEFLNRLCALLNRLPFERLDHELQVLRAEAARGTRGSVGNLRSLRFGPTGYGSVDQAELGLNWVSREQLEEWSQTRFTTRNAVLWMTFAPPANVSIGLPEGSRHEIPPATSLSLPLPCVIHGKDSPVAMTMLAPRSPQGYLAATVIKRELVLDLRHKRGLSYSPVVAYERLDRESAEVLVGCDALPENRAAVTTAMLETLDRLADDIPQEAIQEAVGDLGKIAADDRDAQVAELADQAMACLEQRPFVSRATVVEQLRQLASRELGQVVKGLRSTELLRIPLGVPAPAGFSLYPEGSQKVLAGKRVKSSKGKEHLVLSQRGLTFIEADEKTHTIEYEDCVAVLVWPNGTQSLIARDGSWIRLKTAAWSQPELIRAEIRAHVPPEKIVPMREDLPAKPPQDSCSQCGSEPAIKVHFMTVTGLVLLLRYRHHKGVVCRECGIEAFRRLTNQTLLAGWWGFFAWIMNLAALTRNFIERWRLARLAPPDKSKGYRPANPGRPLWQRNGMLTTLLFVALVIAFVTVSSRP